MKKRIIIGGLIILGAALKYKSEREKNLRLEGENKNLRDQNAGLLRSVNNLSYQLGKAQGQKRNK